MSEYQTTSPSNRGRSRRMRSAGAALALTAAATMGGIAVAAPASAKTLGTTTFTVPGHPQQAWGATWGQAWDACQYQNRRTRSIELLKVVRWTNPDSTTVTWACRDTP